MTTPVPAPDSDLASAESDQTSTGTDGALAADVVESWHEGLGYLPNGTSVGTDPACPASLELTGAHPSGLAQLLAGRPVRLSGLVRERSALSAARRSVRAIQDACAELEEERGLHACYLLVGEATWLGTGSATASGRARAGGMQGHPVLLRPCVLRPRDAGAADYDVDLGDAAVLNPLLVDALATRHAVHLDPVALAALAVAEHGFDPHPVFAELEQAARQVPGFTVRQRLVLGTFASVRLSLERDLAVVAEHPSSPTLRRLAVAASGTPSAGTGQDAGPAPERSPTDELLVLDTDGWQQRVVDDVLAGESLVVQGPPGTGKTQVVASVVATLSACGSTSLVVAGKRAALTALHERLAEVGLSELVLDVSGADLARRASAAQVLSSVTGAGQVPAPDTGAALARVLASREVLQAHAEAMHAPREPWGVSVHEAQVRLTELTGRRPAPGSRVQLDPAALRELAGDRLQEVRELLVEAARLGAFTLTPADTAWFDADIDTPEQAGQAVDLARRVFEESLPAARSALGPLAEAAGLRPAATVADWERQLSLLVGLRETLDIFLPSLFEHPLAELVMATADRSWRREHGVDAGLAVRSRGRRRARALVRPGVRVPDLHRALVRAQEQRRGWQQEAAAGGWPRVPPGLIDAEVALQVLQGDLAQLGRLLARTPDGGDLVHAGLDELTRRVARLAGDAEAMRTLPARTTAVAALRQAGLGELLDDLRRRRVPEDRVRQELDLVWWSTWLRSVAEQDPRYGGHDGDALRRAVQEHREADRAWLATGAARVRHAVAERVRQVAGQRPDQLAALEEAWVRPVPLDRLAAGAADLLMAARPCWTTSPLLVPQAVPDGVRFDVVVVEEASQLSVPEVVSALARGAQLLVLGDVHQLPPSRGSSVLEAANAVLPRRELVWQYRARDERLVRLLDREVYGGALRTPPGVRDPRRLSGHQVRGAGAASSGQTGSGRAGSDPAGSGGADPVDSPQVEVERVVAMALEHAATRPRESLLVATGSRRHARRVADALRAELVARPELAGYFSPQRPEPVLVRDLRRAQGDVRDVVLLSLGLGRTTGGQVPHRFGVLDDVDGVNQLVVGLTRARKRTVVVSSFGAQDLDPTRLRTPGARLLYHVLAEVAAASGPPGGDGTQGDRPADAPAPGDLAPDDLAPDALLGELQGRLARAGLPVRARYGTPDLQVDLALEDPRHPGRMLLAVRYDGPQYAAIPRLRDRERRVDEQLQRMGWQVLRVWSTDVFSEPQAEVARIRRAWDRASGVPPGGGRDDDPLTGRSAEDADRGWGHDGSASPEELRRRDEQRLLDERPPHWE